MRENAVDIKLICLGDLVSLPLWGNNSPQIYCWRRQSFDTARSEAHTRERERNFEEWQMQDLSNRAVCQDLLTLQSNTLNHRCSCFWQYCSARVESPLLCLSIVPATSDHHLLWYYMNVPSSQLKIKSDSVHQHEEKPSAIWWDWQAPWTDCWTKQIAVSAGAELSS